MYQKTMPDELGIVAPNAIISTVTTTGTNAEYEDSTNPCRGLRRIVWSIKKMESN